MLYLLLIFFFPLKL
jgi:hypothetical protein